MDAVYAVLLMEGAQNCPSLVGSDFSVLKSEFPEDPTHDYQWLEERILTSMGLDKEGNDIRGAAGGWGGEGWGGGGWGDGGWGGCGGGGGGIGAGGGDGYGLGGGGGSAGRGPDFAAQFAGTTQQVPFGYGANGWHGASSGQDKRPRVGQMDDFLSQQGRTPGAAQAPAGAAPWSWSGYR